MRFISRKEVRQMMGGISAQTFWRLQKRGILPPSVNAPGKPLREDQVLAAMQKLAGEKPEQVVGN
ncbi:helix-turn-helix transcriptional regulator [Phyllobacterium pellucidum]|uniref:helix-turn-helix transcriptional regulator n=1 Tax=Phyllobacterium pellucidum TaxID=2740464 RepID=UPI001D136625|nr:hypothetical protein [Phyllobacterium sp. T1018]UGY08655.1 hypothetical protein LLE51_011460 [Phyllobacterium sp. T1018]